MISSNSNQISSDAVPTTVVNGFLGSGKTTIISHLLDELASKKIKAAYIKNEVGDTDLDAKLIKGKNIATKELLNGCICCTLVGPFMSAVDELIESYHPDRIIIESAGTADPASLALSVSNHPSLVRDGVIAIIDVLNFEGYEDISQVARRQTELTDLIVFNKVELVDEQRKLAVVGYVRELNEYTPIVEAPQGRLNPDLAFGLSSARMDQELKGHSENHHHQVSDEITAFTLEVSQPLDQAIFEEFLLALPKNIFRVKGVVNFKDQDQLVINKVFKRHHFSPLPKLETTINNQLTFIGFKVEDLKSNVSAHLAKCFV